MLYDPYKFPKDNIIGLDDALDTRVAKSGDTMTGDLNIFGDNDLIYEGTVGLNMPIAITNGSTISITVGGAQVYTGDGVTNAPLYLVRNNEKSALCIPYGKGVNLSNPTTWTAKVYRSNTLVKLNVSGDVVDGKGNKLSQKADTSTLGTKVDTTVIADDFSTSVSYAVGDYVMYNGVLYKCTTAHTGTWAAADFTATLVSDEFGSGGGGGGVADLSAIAPTFSDSTVYAVGKYVTYQGKLYRCTTRHTAGAWNPAHFTETNVDADFMAKTRDYVTAGRASNSTAGNYSTAEGSGNVASGTNSHAEGTGNSATNNTAHAEGQDNAAGGSASHVENYHNTITSGGLGAHAEGYNNNVSAYYSHAEGENNTVSHRGSHVEGRYNQSGAQYQHISGQYNVGKSTTILEVGNGTGTNARANAFEIEADGDVIAAGEITDGGNNVLSDKYDATSLVFVNERFTISASGWSSTQTSGYYTYTLSTGNTKYNTYSDVTMANVGVDDSTDATSAEKAAYALVNKFDMADGTGVDSFTLYAKTKPTTTFYIKLSGRYMAKNAASSTKALDITTGCSLTLVDNNRSLPFNGSKNRTLAFRYYVKEIKTTDWSSVVNASGYYSCFISLNADMCPFAMRPIVSIYGLPTAAEAAAYALVDYFNVADASAISSVYAYAKTKPTSDFTITITGVYFA